MERKKEVRQQILEKRMAKDMLEWQNDTEIITKEVVEHDWFREATDIYCYVDCKGEVGTRLIMEEALRLGKSLWVPKVEGTDLLFYEIDSFDNLSPGCFDIMEPKETNVADGLDGLCIIPGVAFDWSCNRIGYGQGYYDRYLLAHPKLHTIGIAFDIQIVDEVSCNEEDIRPEILITETTIIKKRTNDA